MSDMLPVLMIYCIICATYLKLHLWLFCCGQRIAQR